MARDFLWLKDTCNDLLRHQRAQSKFSAFDTFLTTNATEEDTRVIGAGSIRETFEISKKTSLIIIYDAMCIFFEMVTPAWFIAIRQEAHIFRLTQLILTSRTPQK